MKYLSKIVLSLGCSLLIIGLLFGLSGAAGKEISPAVILSAVKGALPAFVAVYVVCQILQTVFRAGRARLLLRSSLPDGSRVPGFFHLMLVTFVRGACADMLPARIGELSYVAMLNKGCAVPAADCLSSLSIGLLFDFVALLGVLAVAIPAATQGLSLVGSLIMLAVICVVGTVCLFYLFPLVMRRLAPLRAQCRFKPLSALLKLADDTANAVVLTRRGGVAIRVILFSIAVRLAKYAGLYCLFVAVTRPLWPVLSQAGVFSVLVALIAAEGAASLPVPTFMSFGSYEAGGLAALTALGFPTLDSMSAMIAMHVLSQIIDYSLGGLAFLIFTWGTAAQPSSGDSPVASPGRFRKTAALLVSLGLLGALLLFAAFQYRASVKRGRLTPPPVGQSVAIPAEEMTRQMLPVKDFTGKIVWSSNREGLHDLYIMTLPEMKVRHLTKSSFTDTYPRFSPDGGKIAFSRSTESWVSQRNWEKWDTWVLDLDSGVEKRVATNAYMAVWSPDGGSLIYMREGGRKIAESRVDGVGEERVLVSVPSEFIPEGTLISIPDVRAGDPWLAATLRGKINSTAFIYADGSYTNLAKGCQIVWRRDAAGEVTWIGHPGKQKNAVFAQEFGGEAQMIFDVAGDYSHEYFPAYSKDGRWLVFGASTGGHEQDCEDYEIFLLDTASSNAVPARLTFHTGNDCWPDIFLAE